MSSPAIMAHPSAVTLAEALRRIAEALEVLPLDQSIPKVSMFVQPRGGTESEQVDLVNAVAAALFGDAVPASTVHMEHTPGMWHHQACGGVATVDVSVFTAVSPVPPGFLDVDAMPLGECSECHRRTWSYRSRGTTCLMTQPNGLRCLGTILALP